MAGSYEGDLAEVEAELARLDGPALLAELRGHVAGWRAVEGSSAFFLPLPLVARDVPSVAGAWTEPGDVFRHELVGLDDRGRPVLHLLEPGERLQHAWRWDADGSFLEVELMGSGPHVRRARAVDGRIERVVTASRGSEVSVTVLAWQDGLAVRADRAMRRTGGGGMARATEGRIRDGEVWQLRSGARDTGDDLGAALDEAAAIEPDALVWDGRVARPEPWPGLEAAGRLVEPLAHALDTALREAVAASGIEAPFVLEVRQHSGGSRQWAFPPFARVAGTRWRDGMRASSRQERAAIEHLWRGEESGLTAGIELTDRLGGEALRACRTLSTALRVTGPRRQRDEGRQVAKALGDRLVELLHAAPLPGAADPQLALVHVGDDADPLDRARAVVGPERVERFLASIAPAGRPPRDRDLERHARTDRAALRELLARSPLAAHAGRLADEVAADARLLEPAPDGRSRLGGPPLLPAGEPWPVCDDGLPHTFLAAIALADLPSSALPGEGWLLFFAALSSDGTDGLLEEAPNAPGSAARLYLTADAVPGRPLREPPGGTLGERRVRAAPRLSLPDDSEAAQRLGLDVFEADAYEELRERLMDPDEPHHWIGGHASGTQGDAPDEGTTLLLHLDWDEALGFEYLDAATIQFRIPDAALAAGDFTQAYALVESG